METKSVVKEVIKNHCSLENIEDDVSLVELGYIDSLNVLEIITELEAKFSIQFDEDDYQMEKLSSVTSINQTIQAKLNL